MNKHTKNQPEPPDEILCRFQRKLRKYGINSHIHIFDDSTAQNHIKIESIRIKLVLTVTVSADGRLEIMTADQNQRIHATPDDAIGIITALARKENQ